jgi:ankyrin repeat protein
MDFHDIEAVKMLMEAGAEVDEFNGAHVGGERPWVVPALHQAARRLAPVAMAELLLDAGASATREFEGVTPYSMARVYGNRDLARLLEARGAATVSTGKKRFWPAPPTARTARANTSIPRSCRRRIAA